jgi:hypothetical protein
MVSCPINLSEKDNLTHIVGAAAAKPGRADPQETPRIIMVESKLTQATRHVAEGRRLVARQRALVAREKKAGRDALLAESLLGQFEDLLARFEDDLRAISQNSN